MTHANTAEFLEFEKQCKNEEEENKGGDNANNNSLLKPPLLAPPRLVQPKKNSLSLGKKNVINLNPASVQNPLKKEDNDDDDDEDLVGKEVSQKRYSKNGLFFKNKKLLSYYNLPSLF